MKQQHFNLCLKGGFLSVAIGLLLLLVCIYGGLGQQCILLGPVVFVLLGIVMLIFAFKFPPVINHKKECLKEIITSYKSAVMIKEQSWGDGLLIDMPRGKFDLTSDIEVIRKIDSVTGSIVETNIQSIELYPIKDLSEIDFSRNPYAGDSDLLTIGPPDLEKNEIDSALRKCNGCENPTFIHRENRIVGFVLSVGGHYITFQPVKQDQNYMLRILVGPYAPEQNPPAS